MSDIVQDLKVKRQKIVEIQGNQSKLEGQREQLLKQLKDRFGVESIAEAKKKLGKSVIEVDKHELKLKEISEKMDSIIKGAVPRPGDEQ